MANEEYKSDLQDVKVIILDTRDRAVKVRRIADGKVGWFTLSQSELSGNEDGTHVLTAPSWLMQQKGFA